MFCSIFLAATAIAVFAAIGSSGATGQPVTDNAFHPWQARTLTFADRVAYQRAVEEVYWRHRIWPDTNPGPKPSLDAVMSQAQLETKVTDYLCNSQTVEDHWHRPITADQLQSEMERMASHTKQPDVLREIFEALGNDPFVIAECLARPVLAERLTNGDAVAAQPDLGASRTGVPPGPAVIPTPLQGVIRNVPQARGYSERLMTMAAVNANYTLPVIAGLSGGCIDDTWTPTTLTNAYARSDHTAVWTGSEMIVWGGSVSVFGWGTFYFNTGGRYNPSTDSWTATTTTNSPAGRANPTAVWTGSEMIVWGGYVSVKCSIGCLCAGCPCLCPHPFDTGGRYNPITNSWTATSTTNAPSARSGHTAVWTGSEMIVWGGYDNTGGRYNPVQTVGQQPPTTTPPLAGSVTRQSGPRIK